MNNVAYVFGLEILSVEIHVLYVPCIYTHMYLVENYFVNTCCHLNTKFVIFNDFLQYGIVFWVICVSMAWFALDSLTPVL